MRGREHLIVDTLIPGVLVVRFAQPDLRQALYDDANIDGCTLFRAFQDAVRSGLKEGRALVLNLGLVEPLPTVFLRFLLRVRQLVKTYHGHLLLCRLSKEHQDMLQVSKAVRLFHITNTEARAIHEAEVHRSLAETLRRSRSLGCTAR